MFQFSFLSPLFLWYLPFAVFVVGYLFLSYAISATSTDFDMSEHDLRQQLIRDTPKIDVFLPVCGEPIDILRNTWEAVSDIDWPKDRLSVFVLDDGANEKARALAEEFGFTYVVRPNRGEMKKAGNLRYTFQRTDGEFILILDADFAPRPDIVKELYAWMENDRKIAIVQSPQYFDCDPRAPWVQAGAAYIQELFYRLIQVSRDNHQAAICVGSCALYRREALTPFGGTAEIGYSEDVHTGFNCMVAGWTVKYLPINLAKGVCPDNVSGFFNQQYRWAMGSLTLSCNPLFWTARNIRWSQRICFISGFGYYIATGVGVFLTPLPPLLLAFVFPDLIHYKSTLHALPSLIYGTMGMALWTRAPFGFYSLRIRVLQSWSHLFAVVDKVRGKTVPWIPTGSISANEGRVLVAKNVAIVYALGVFLAVLVLLAPRVITGDFSVTPTVGLAFFQAALTFLAFR